MADPRFLDPAVDPNGRPPPPADGTGACFMGRPEAAGHAPAGLARFCTLRSWLSQWSYDFSAADGPKHLARVRVPVLVVENECDDAVPRSHVRAMFAALPDGHDKELRVIAGANHYYSGAGMRPKLVECCQAIMGWLRARGLLAAE